MSGGPNATRTPCARCGSERSWFPRPGMSRPINQAPTLVIIRPSMGFGAGHHASTRLCLGALQAASVAGRSVLDLGTWSGVLAIAAAKRGASHVVTIDNDPDHWSLPATTSPSTTSRWPSCCTAAIFVTSTPMTQSRRRSSWLMSPERCWPINPRRFSKPSLREARSSWVASRPPRRPPSATHSLRRPRWSTVQA